MKIKNWEKLNSEKFSILNAQFYITDSMTISESKYKLSIYEKYTNDHFADVNIEFTHPHSNKQIKCTYHFIKDVISNIRITSILNLNEFKNMISFIHSLQYQLVKNNQSSVLKTYLYLLAEIQIEISRKNTLKPIT